MRSTLAIYITLFAVAGVAVAQILYWKLVVARHEARAEEACATDWLPDSLAAWPGVEIEAVQPQFEIEAAEPQFEVEAAEPQFAAEPALAAV